MGRAWLRAISNNYASHQSRANGVGQRNVNSLPVYMEWKGKKWKVDVYCPTGQAVSVTLNCHARDGATLSLWRVAVFLNTGGGGGVARRGRCCYLFLPSFISIPPTSHPSRRFCGGKQQRQTTNINTERWLTTGNHIARYLPFQRKRKAAATFQQYKTSGG